MTTETVLSSERTEEQSFLKRVFRSIGLSFLWGFIAALAIGCLASGIWTFIPTEYLAWGSSKINLVGYLSHCSFTPISTIVLLGTSLIGFALALKMRARNPIGYTVMGITGIATLIGILRGGLDIAMFIGMGTGVGIGIVLAIVFDLFMGNWS